MPATDHSSPGSETEHAEATALTESHDTSVNHFEDNPVHEQFPVELVGRVGVDADGEPSQHTLSDDFITATIRETYASLQLANPDPDPQPRRAVHEIYATLLSVAIDRLNARISLGASNLFDTASIAPLVIDTFTALSRAHLGKLDLITMARERLSCRERYSEVETMQTLFETGGTTEAITLESMAVLLAPTRCLKEFEPDSLGSLKANAFLGPRCPIDATELGDVPFNDLIEAQEAKLEDVKRTLMVNPPGEGAVVPTNDRNAKLMPYLPEGLSFIQQNARLWPLCQAERALESLVWMKEYASQTERRRAAAEEDESAVTASMGAVSIDDVDKVTEETEEADEEKGEADEEKGNEG